MGIKVKHPPHTSDLPNHWRLQNAKARFSELVRRAKNEGPQHVSVHGRDEVVIISEEEYQQLQGGMTGQVLIDAMQASPYRELELEPQRMPMNPWTP